MQGRTRQLTLLIGMGLGTGLCGCSQTADETADADQEPVRYVTEQALFENIARQIELSPHTVAEFREYGVAEESELKLEFLFYTDTMAKAQGLASALLALNYDAESRRSAGELPLYVVTGSTVPIKIDAETVVAWTEQMCRLGYEHDAEFDGWRANPNP